MTDINKLTTKQIEILDLCKKNNDCIFFTQVFPDIYTNKYNAKVAIQRLLSLSFLETDEYNQRLYRRKYPTLIESLILAENLPKIRQLSLDRFQKEQ